MIDNKPYIEHIKSRSKKEIWQEFLSISSPKELSKFLDVRFNWLNYHLYLSSSDKSYSSSDKSYKIFEIPKKSGGKRIITAPVGSIKVIQQKLNAVLQKIYSNKKNYSAHGFIEDHSIVSNANVHTNKRFVFNTDLEDFFPSINFGRVRGMFMAKPYNLPDNVSTVLAQICCYNNQLPQGAPTSPIITNMICSKLDSQLRKVAYKSKCNYSRYADDITFSSNSNDFLSDIAYYDINQNSVLGEFGKELRTIIESNGFKININKTRMQTWEYRQEVTGLTVNEFPNVKRTYVRQIRAMFHAWEKFGLENAERDFKERYYRKYKHPSKKNPPKFKQVLKGKIEFLGMVRGKDDEIYIRFINKYLLLTGKLKTQIGITEQLDQIKSNFDSLTSDFKKFKFLITDIINNNSRIDILHNEIYYINSKIKSIEAKIDSFENIEIQNKSDEEPNKISFDANKEINSLGKMIGSLANDIINLKNDNKLIKNKIRIDIEPSIDYSYIKDEKIRDKFVNYNINMEESRKQNNFVMYCFFGEKQIEYIMNFCFDKLKSDFEANQEKILCKYTQIKNKGNISVEVSRDNLIIDKNNNPRRNQKHLILISYCFEVNDKLNELKNLYYLLLNIYKARCEAAHSYEDNINEHYLKFKNEEDYSQIQKTIQFYVESLYQFLNNKQEQRITIQPKRY